MKKKRDPKISKLVTETKAAADRMTPERFLMLDRRAAKCFPPDVEQFVEEMTDIPANASPALKESTLTLRESIKVGFVLAVIRFRHELKNNAEANRIINARLNGGDRGREKMSLKREQQAERIRTTWASIEAAGEKPTNAKVAQECGCSVSTVIRAFKIRQAKRAKR